MQARVHDAVASLRPRLLLAGRHHLDRDRNRLRIGGERRERLQFPARLDLLLRPLVLHLVGPVELDPVLVCVDVGIGCDSVRVRDVLEGIGNPDVAERLAVRPRAFLDRHAVDRDAVHGRLGGLLRRERRRGAGHSLHQLLHR